MIGFLKDTRRLNVSITRARHGLIIIGDAHCLSKSIGEKENKYSIWRYLIKYYQDLGVIVDYIDGEKEEKMFQKTKIIEEQDDMKDYNFIEYDYDGSGNKHLSMDEYNDNFWENKNNNYLEHYMDDFDFFSDYDDEFFNNEEFIEEFFDKFENDNYERYNHNDNDNYENYDNM